MKKVILFAGVPGAGKTPIAYYLSWNLRLPILNNDAVRSEVIENVGRFDEEKFRSTTGERLSKVLSTSMNFIDDASIDRWYSSATSASQKFQDNGYKLLVISLDLSLKKIQELWAAKNYGFTEDWPEKLNQWFDDHSHFLEHHDERRGGGVHIDDDNYLSRLDIALAAAREFLKEDV